MLSLRTDFNIPPDTIYLNASYMGPSPKPVTEIGKLHLGAKETPWNLGSDYYFEESEKLRQVFAALLGAKADNIALVPAVSYGEETAVANLPVRADQNVVMPEGDFPSNYYPWREYSKRAGFEIKQVKRPWNYDWTTAILNSIDERTAVVCVPQCDWSDGTRFDLKIISAAAKKVGAALVVDLSQSFGAVPFPLAEVDPDFVACVGYKWLLGPYGVSYLYVADRHLNGRPLENNWINRKDSHNFSALTDYKEEYLPGARRFDSGQHSQFMQNPMAREALDYIAKTGLRNIFEHCRFLNRRLASGLEELGFAVAPEEFRVGHLLGARPPTGINPKLLRDSLQRERAFVSVRNNALRISPHLYNSREDIETFLSRVRHLLRDKFISFIDSID